MKRGRTPRAVTVVRLPIEDLLETHDASIVEKPAISLEIVRMVIGAIDVTTAGKVDINCEIAPSLLIKAVRLAVAAALRPIALQKNHVLVLALIPDLETKVP